MASSEKGSFCRLSLLHEHLPFFRKKCKRLQNKTFYECTNTMQNYVNTFPQKKLNKFTYGWLQIFNPLLLMNLIWSIWITQTRDLPKSSCWNKAYINWTIINTSCVNPKSWTTGTDLTNICRWVVPRKASAVWGNWSLVKKKQKKL